MTMVRAVFLVEGKQSLDLGSVVSEAHLPRLGERVELNGAAYRVQARNFKYDWNSTAGVVERMNLRIEVNLLPWEPW